MPLPPAAVAALPWIAAAIDAQAGGVTDPDELRRTALEAGATEEEWRTTAPFSSGARVVRS